MEHIDKMGIELEGGYYNLKPDQRDLFKGDGSVHIERRGSCDCFQDCECYDECECEQCEQCQGCGSSLDSCECFNCMFCQGCDNTLDNCNCDRHDPECKNKKCKAYEPCDNCDQNFNDNQEVNYDCSNGAGISWDCQRACNCECQCECECLSVNSVGELVSLPLNKVSLLLWIDNNYPDITNKTCGAHIHFSMKSLKDYSLLMTKEFYNYFEDKMHEFGKINHIKKGSQFWIRLNGENSYCMKKFDMEKQCRALGREWGDRFNHLNACYHAHGTIECRLLPCFEKKHLTQNGVYYLHKIINDYLDNLKDKAQEIKGRFVLK